MNTKKQFGLKTFLTLSLFALISCSNLIQQNNDSSQQDKPSADGNTYLVIKSATLKQTSRSAQNNFGPGLADAKLENLVDLKIFSISDSGTEKKIVEAETYEKLIEKTIPVEPGNWKFKLTAELMGVPFSGTTPVEIKAGVENSVSFTLTSDVLSGKLSFTVSWAKAEENSNANKIEVVLKKAVSPLSQDNEPAIVTKVIEVEDITDKSASVKIDKLDNGNELSGGTYYLQLKFYNEGTVAALNTTEYYVNIINGLTTYADLEVNLKETFKITYEANDGELVSGAVQPLNCFSQLSEDITLPAMTKPGYFWGGWYDNEDFTGEPITKIPASSDKNWTVYAKWNEPVLYVSGTGDDTTGTGTEANPFETIEEACKKIIATGDETMDWIIYIMGDVTGKHSSTRKAGERSYAASDYGRSNIPETLTLDYAQSIMLIGANEELDENDNPQDMINRGLSLSNVSSTETGTALAIFTEVPVTIKRLKITKGSNSLDCYNTTNGVHGGGIYIGTNSIVTLDDDTLIINNGYRSAGGIFNDGTLYMVGKSYIGDRTATSLANGLTSCSNTGAWGAGLYNKGTVYLGTEEKELKGGIYYNYGSTGLGGGIYSECGTIEMHSGTIAYNDGASQGGGIYIKAGTFNMTGGSIHHNSTGGQGGGVYIDVGATFNFTGGTINANWATSGGGGVYLYGNSSTPGIMYMYGTAVIGDKSQTSAPTSRNGANATDGNGAGICVTNGKFYMGYSSYTSETDNVTEDLDGGIYYNYNTSTSNDSKGGGIFANGGQGQPNSSSSANATVRIHSGTIANNYCKNGGAICTPGGAIPLVIGGDVKIPSGPNHENDVLIYSNYNRLFIEDSLKEITSDNPIYIKLSSSEGKNYNSSSGLMLAQNATISSLSEVLDKFAVQPLMNKNNGIVTHWLLDPSTGNVVQNSSTFYVASLAKNGSDSNTGLASNSPLASITKAIEKINELNDENKDYIIEVNGEILGPQIIADPSETVKIKANSIYIKGKNSNSASLDDIINANLGDSEEGSALSIDTKVPVTLYYIGITGGHGNLIDSGTKVAGGGLYIGDNTTVSLEGKVHIYNNSNYYGGTDISGFGGGIYVGENTKLYIPSSAVDVRENKSTHYGAGIYVTNGAYVTMPAAAKIRDNSFDERFTQDGQAVSTYGGGVYIADNATFEMTNGTISGNTANTTGTTSGLGNGIFVSGTAGAEAHFKLGALGMVGLTNDVYLQNNVPIEIISTLTSTSANAARITPGAYPTEDKPLELLTFASESITKSYAAGKLEITPQTLPNGEKQYWYINSDCKLEKRTEIGITISVPAGAQNDIQVEVNGTNVKNNKHFTGTSTLEFTVIDDSNYQEVVWMVDGDEDSKEWSSSFEFDPSGKAKGVYVVYLEAKDYDGHYYSYTAQVTIE